MSSKSVSSGSSSYFFDDNKELFRLLSDHYNRETYGFEFKSVGERNQALKLLER